MQLIHTVTSQGFDPEAKDYEHPRGQVVTRTVLADTTSVSVGDVEVERSEDGTFTVPDGAAQHLVDNVLGWEVYKGVLPSEDGATLVERQAERIAELEAQLAKKTVRKKVEE